MAIIGYEEYRTLECGGCGVHPHYTDGYAVSCVACMAECLDVSPVSTPSTLATIHGLPDGWECLEVLPQEVPQ